MILLIVLCLRHVRFLLIRLFVDRASVDTVVADTVVADMIVADTVVVVDSVAVDMGLVVAVDTTVVAPGVGLLLVARVVGLIVETGLSKLTSARHKLPVSPHPPLPLFPPAGSTDPPLLLLLLRGLRVGTLGGRRPIRAVDAELRRDVLVERHALLRRTSCGFYLLHRPPTQTNVGFLQFIGRGNSWERWGKPGIRG